MAINTYATLVTAVENWLARGDLTDRIPEFIALAEAKFNRVLMHPGMETRSTAVVDTGSTEPEFISLPGDFQSMRRVRLSSVTGKPALLYLSQTQMADYRFSIDNVTGQPVYYSIMGGELELAPTPNDDYTLEMVYRAYIPALTSTNTTNWLLTLAPDLYLYGALLESAPHIKEDERLPVWANAVSTVIDQLNTLGERQSVNAGPSTVTLPGVAP